MIRDFSKDELESVESSRDTELTLGGGTLIALGGGLLLLCTIFFCLGYFFGHHSSSDAATIVVSPSHSKLPPVPVGSGSKPGAAGQAPVRPQTQAVTAVPHDSYADSAKSAQNVAEVSTGSTIASQAKVRPALAGQATGSPSGSALQVQPAMTQVQGWMVQIAAVSRSEDAEVLVNALRKRGYTVTARRDVGDSLIHVQTGPFVNRNDANSMRQKLLNDGYNAIVQ